MKNTIKKYLSIMGIKDEAAGDILKALFKNFDLIPRRTANLDEKIFLEIRFGFFANSLSVEEITLYLFLWEWGLQDWRDKTDEVMGPFEFVTLDIMIWQYIRILRLSKKELTIDVTPDTPGFMAEALYQKYGLLRDKTWPRLYSRRGKGEESEKEESVEVAEYQEVQMYRVGDQEYTQEEYEAWMAGLDPDKKVAMLGHVTPFMKKILREEIPNE